MAIPAEISNTWQILHNEVSWLHGRWTMYCQLYGTSPERIELLNRVSPTLFSTLQDIQLDDIQLTLSRLADPSATGKRRNLTLETLLEEIQGLGVEDLAPQLVPLLAGFRECCIGIIERRNKLIAHNDFRARQQAGSTIPGASRDEIEAALDALRTFMRAIFAYFEKSHMAYEHFVLVDDAMALLYTAKRAVRYQELVSDGAIEATDLTKSKYWKV